MAEEDIELDYEDGDDLQIGDEEATDAQDKDQPDTAAETEDQSIQGQATPEDGSDQQAAESQSAKHKPIQFTQDAANGTGSDVDKASSRDVKPKPVFSNPTSHPNIGSNGAGNIRYFIIRSNCQANVDISVREGAWSTTRRNELKLNQAFQTSSEVRLLFFTVQSYGFQGYACMRSGVGQLGRPIRWDGGIVFGSPFAVDWRCLVEVSRADVGNMRNPLNEDRPILTALDGQEVPQELGDQIVAIMEQKAKAKGIAPPKQQVRLRGMQPGRGPGPGPTKADPQKMHGQPGQFGGRGSGPGRGRMSVERDMGPSVMPAMLGGAVRPPMLGQMGMMPGGLGLPSMDAMMDGMALQGPMNPRMMEAMALQGAGIRPGANVPLGPMGAGMGMPLQMSAGGGQFPMHGQLTSAQVQQQQQQQLMQRQQQQLQQRQQPMQQSTAMQAHTMGRRFAGQDNGRDEHRGGHEHRHRSESRGRSRSRSRSRDRDSRPGLEEMTYEEYLEYYRKVKRKMEELKQADQRRTPEKQLPQQQQQQLVPSSMAAGTMSVMGAPGWWHDGQRYAWHDAWHESYGWHGHGPHGHGRHGMNPMAGMMGQAAGHMGMMGAMPGMMGAAGMMGAPGLVNPSMLMMGAGMGQAKPGGQPYNEAEYVELTIKHFKSQGQQPPSEDYIRQHYRQQREAVLGR